MNNQPTVLVIAGTDSSGGAGLTRDLRVLADCDVAAAAAVTAVTAQTHSRVRAVHPMPPDLIREQIRSALESNRVCAIKIGMLGTAEAVDAVARSLPVRHAVPVVLDPVMAASAGGVLLDDDARVALRDLLLPNVTLLTPNIPEAQRLLAIPPANGVFCAADEPTLVDYARGLRNLGPEAVLIKGGHTDGAACVDLLVTGDDDVLHLTAPRLPVQMRGTGCSLASAIAAGLARGLPLADACRFAKNYLTEQLQLRTEPQFSASRPTRIV